jgi:SAM-dependent methyltransferase
MGKLEDVSALYEARPYPPVSLFSRLRRDDLPLLNYEAGYASCYGNLDGAPERARILVAGCGTFEPVAVAMANPAAEILAVDLSARSLAKLRWQARLRGVSGRIRTLCSDIERLPEGGFDYVVATGVLHHLEDPLRGLRALVERSQPKAVFRIMVYSRWGRDLLYGAKRLAQRLGVRTPKEMRRIIAALPASHPYKIYFHLYSDTATDTGLADGYLHPCDQPFDALSLRDYLAAAGLEATRFLHRPEGQPEPDGSWESLAVKEALGELEENFCFFAGRGKPSVQGAPLAWNPALPLRGSFHSRLLGAAAVFDRRQLPSGREAERLQRALFLLPGRNHG